MPDQVCGSAYCEVAVEIGVPEWVYNGIVKKEGHPHILTINPDYFLIRQSIGRVIGA